MPRSIEAILDEQVEAQEIPQNAAREALLASLRRRLMLLAGGLLSCSHAQTTFPRGHRGAEYVVCLDCGAEFWYDWREMKMGGRR